MVNYKQLLKEVNTFIFDYDGVLTDGTVFLTDHGEPLRTANVIISGGKSKSMFNRFKTLNITDIYLGIENKLEVFNQYIKENKIDPAHVLYMGDDIPDFNIMKEVGVPACPADASEEIKAISKYISHHKGGRGCARDVIEQVMKIQGKWMNDDAYHW
ncbi:KdsC family phosphatase [Bacteroidota bacterium]